MSGSLYALVHMLGRGVSTDSTGLILLILSWLRYMRSCVCSLPPSSSSFVVLLVVAAPLLSGVPLSPFPFPLSSIPSPAPPFIPSPLHTSCTVALTTPLQLSCPTNYRHAILSCPLTIHPRASPSLPLTAAHPVLSTQYSDLDEGHAYTIPYDTHPSLHPTRPLPYNTHRLHSRARTSVLFSS